MVLFESPRHRIKCRLTWGAALVLATLLSGCPHQRISNQPSAQLQINVLDEEGMPVRNATVTVGLIDLEDRILVEDYCVTQADNGCTFRWLDPGTSGSTRTPIQAGSWYRIRVFAGFTYVIDQKFHLKENEVALEIRPTRKEIDVEDDSGVIQYDWNLVRGSVRTGN